jgi:polar amino acid transport system substrate-binding protein
MNRRDMLLTALASAWVTGPARAEGAPTIRVGYFDAYWPMSRRQVDATMDGALVDSLRIIGRKARMELEHHGYPWARVQQMIQRGDLDAFCTIRTDERRQYALFCSTPVISVAYGVYHRANDLRPLQAKSIADLRQFRQGTYLGSGYSKQYLENDRLQFDKDEASVLRRIALGNLDTFVEGEYVKSTVVKDLGLSDQLRFTPMPFLPTADYCFGLRKSFPDAQAVVDRMESAVIASKASGDLQAVVGRYF